MIYDFEAPLGFSSDFCALDLFNHLSLTPLLYITNFHFLRDSITLIYCTTVSKKNHQSDFDIDLELSIIKNIKQTNICFLFFLKFLLLILTKFMGRFWLLGVQIGYFGGQDQECLWVYSLLFIYFL